MVGGSEGTAPGQKGLTDPVSALSSHAWLSQSSILAGLLEKAVSGHDRPSVKLPELLEAPSLAGKGLSAIFVVMYPMQM